MQDEINQFFKDHKTAGRILTAFALVTQVLTIYVIILLLYENKTELLNALKGAVKYIVKGDIK